LVYFQVILVYFKLFLVYFKLFLAYLQGMRQAYVRQLQPLHRYIASCQRH
jgi:hypothetical protein